MARPSRTRTRTSTVTDRGRTPAGQVPSDDALSRIGVAIDTELLARFDALIEARGYSTRSEAFRHLIRDELVEETVARDDADAVGTITLVYDHHERLLNSRLTAMQHDHQEAMLSTLHVHLDHDHCLEVVVVRGRAGELRRIADALLSMKGVKHGTLTQTLDWGRV